MSKLCSVKIKLNLAFSIIELRTYFKFDNIFPSITCECGNINYYVFFFQLDVTNTNIVPPERHNLQPEQIEVIILN